MEQDLPLLVVQKQREKVTATLEPQAGDRAGVAVVLLAQVAGLASSAGVWQRLVMLVAGPKGSAILALGLQAVQGLFVGKGVLWVLKSADVHICLNPFITCRPFSGSVNLGSAGRKS